MSVPLSALRPLETLVNNALSYDPGTRAALQKLAGKSVEVEITTPPLSVNIRLEEEGRISLENPESGAADVKLSGNPLALARLLSRAQTTYSFTGSGVTVEGDHELLRSIAGILAVLDIDWEQALAGILGDTPAHLAGEAVRSASSWFADFRQRSQTGVSEFVREESGLTVSDTEARGWFDSVNHLAADSERLAARVNRLRILIEQGEEQD